MRFVFGLLAAAILLGLSACQTKPPKFTAIAEEFVFNTLTFSPATATAVGYHIHNGIPMDELLDEYSRPALDRQLGYYGRFRAGLKKDVDAAKLEPQDQADLALVQRSIAQALFAIQQTEDYRHDPRLYANAIAKGLLVPYLQPYKPVGVRFYHLLKRIERIPARVEQAKATLVNVPEAWRDDALAQTEANLQLLAQIGRERPADMTKKFDTALPEAQKALESFREFLTKTVTTQGRYPRLGPEKYRQRWAMLYGSTLTPEQVLATAEADLAQWRKALAPLAKVQQTSGALGTLEALSGADPFPAPPTKAQLGPRPAFWRGAPWPPDGLLPAPPMEPEISPRLWLPEDEPLTLAMWRLVSGKLGARKAAEGIEPRSRRLLRLLYGSEATVEGWGLYAMAERMEAGAAKGGEGFEKVWLERRIALAEAAAAELHWELEGTPPPVAPRVAPYLGWQRLTQLAAEARQKWGSSYSRERFEKAVLSQGPLPPDLLAPLVLAN